MIHRYLNLVLVFFFIISVQQLSAQTTLDCDVDNKQFVLACAGGRDCIPTLNNPPVIPPSQANYLSDNALILGVYQNGVARAYPHPILWWHEVVNDTLGGEKFLITLCPLTSTGLLFDATINNREHRFGVSGLLYNNNLIMYDLETTSLFPQMCFSGKTGRLEGEQLKLLPIVESTWGAWKTLHPNTTVLSDFTGFDRPYNIYPLGDYRTNHEFLQFPLTNDDRRLPRKNIILGVALNNIERAYPFKAMGTHAVLNDRIGDTDILVVFAERAKMAVPFYRKVDGQETDFVFHETALRGLIFFRDILTGSVWNMRGEAVSGPMAGSGVVLEQIPAYTSMWFGWAAFHENTEIADINAIVTSVNSDLSAIRPDAFELHQNFPNPFNPATTIGYALDEANRVTLKIYDIAGKEIKTLVNNISQQAGQYRVSWSGKNNSGRNVASGMYFYKISMGGLSKSRKMVLLQ